MKSFRLLFFVAVGLSCFSARVATGDTFKIDPSHSRIAFKVRHILGTARGNFTKFSGTLDIDRDHPEQSAVKVTIQTAGIDTASVKRDEHLRGAEFFNVAKFPEITFKSRGVKQTGAAAGDIVGDLTMHGVTLSITLRVELLGDPETATKNQTTRWRITTAPIKRSQFGLVWSPSVETVSMIGDDVSVDIEIEAAKAP